MTTPTPHLLLVGDQHIRHDNLSAIPRLESWIAEYAQAQSIGSSPLTHIVLMGDLLDRHSHVEQPLLARADKLLRNLLSIHPPVHVMVLCGNHDMAHNQVFLTPDHWLIVYTLNPLARLTVIDCPTEIPSLPGMLFMPYTPDGRFIEALDVTYPERKWITLFHTILCHQSFTNIQSIGHLLKEADTWLPECPLVISGHIHDSHWASPNLLYTGSYIPVSNGESNDKKLWVLKCSSQGTTRSDPVPIAVNFLRRTTVEVNHPNDLSKLLTEKPFDPEQHTRVIVKGTQEEIATWTRGMEASVLRAQKNVKVIMRMVPSTLTVSNQTIQSGSEQKNTNPAIKPSASFTELLDEAIASHSMSTSVRELWTEFRSTHVNLFQ